MMRTTHSPTDYMDAADRLIDQWQRLSKEGASATRIQPLLDEATALNRLAHSAMEKAQ